MKHQYQRGCWHSETWERRGRGQRIQETREGGGEREESKGEERGWERQEKGQIASERASGSETQVLRVTALTRKRSKQIERSRRAVRKDLPGCLDAPSHRNT